MTPVELNTPSKLIYCNFVLIALFLVLRANEVLTRELAIGCDIGLE